MRNYYEISADFVTSSDVRHVTRVAGGGVTRLVTRVPLRSETRDTCYEASIVTRVSSRAAAAWVRADSGQTIICYLLAPPARGGHRTPAHRPANYGMIIFLLYKYLVL